MPYIGGKLEPWFNPRHNDAACRTIARAGARRMLELAEANTPIDTGRLRQSWKRKPLVIVVDHLGVPIYTSGVETEVEYAPYVEWGTGLWGPEGAKYEILPKRPDGWLRWQAPTGEFVFAKRVMHPGSPGNHMVAIAAAVTEHELGTIAQPALERWAREVERQNRTGL